MLLSDFLFLGPCMCLVFSCLKEVLGSGLWKKRGEEDLFFFFGGGGKQEKRTKECIITCDSQCINAI